MRININNKMRTLLDRVLLAKNKFNEMIELSTLLNEEYTDAGLIARVNGIIDNLAAITTDAVDYFQNMEDLSDAYLAQYQLDSVDITDQFQTYTGLFDTLLSQLETERINIYASVLAYKGDQPTMDAILPWRKGNIVRPYSLYDNDTPDNGATPDNKFNVFKDGIELFTISIAPLGIQFQIRDGNDSLLNTYTKEDLTTGINASGDDFTVLEIERVRVIVNSDDNSISHYLVGVKLENNSGQAITHQIVRINVGAPDVFVVATSTLTLSHATEPLIFEIMNTFTNDPIINDVKYLIILSGETYLLPVEYDSVHGTVDLSLSSPDSIGYHQDTQTGFVFTGTNMVSIYDVVVDSQTLKTTILTESPIDHEDCNKDYIIIISNMIIIKYSNEILYSRYSQTMIAGYHIDWKTDNYIYLFDENDSVQKSFIIVHRNTETLHPITNTIHGLEETNPRDYRKSLFVPLNDYYPWYTTKSPTGDLYDSVNIVAMSDYILPIPEIGGGAFESFTGGKTSKLLSYGEFLTDVILYHPKSGFVFNSVSNINAKRNYVRINDDFKGNLKLIKSEDYKSIKKTYVDGNGDTITTTQPDLSIRLSASVDNPDKRDMEIMTRRHVEMNSPAPSPFYYYKWKKLGINIYDTDGTNLGQDSEDGPLKDFLSIPDVTNRPTDGDWDVDLSSIKNTLKEEYKIMISKEFVNRPINDSKTIRVINKMNDDRILFVDSGRILVSENGNINGKWLDISSIILTDEFYDNAVQNILENIDNYTVVTDDDLIFVFTGTEILKIKYDFYKGIGCEIVSMSETITNIVNLDGQIFGLDSTGDNLKLYNVTSNTWSVSINFTAPATSFLSDYDNGRFGIYPINGGNTMYISSDLSGAWTSYSSDPTTPFTTPIVMKVYSDNDKIMFTDLGDTLLRVFTTSDTSWTETQMNYTDPNYPSHKIIDIFRLSNNVYGFMDGLSKYMVIYDFDLILQVDTNKYEPSDYHIATHGGVFVMELGDDILIQTKNDGIIYSKKENIDVPTT